MKTNGASRNQEFRSLCTQRKIGRSHRRPSADFLLPLFSISPAQAVNRFETLLLILWGAATAAIAVGIIQRSKGRERRRLNRTAGEQLANVLQESMDAFFQQVVERLGMIKIRTNQKGTSQNRINTGSGN